MSNLKNDLSEYTGTKGICANVSPVSNLELKYEVKTTDYNFVPTLDIHSTIVYSLSQTPPTPQKLNEILESLNVDSTNIFTAYPIQRLEFWEAKGKLYCGLVFYSPDLFMFREKLQKMGNFKSTYDEYKCHLTVGYFDKFDNQNMLAPALARFGSSIFKLTSPIPSQIKFNNLSFSDLK